MLKTHWLDRKRQRQIDHVIVTLMKGMVPMYEKGTTARVSVWTGKILWVNGDRSF